MIISWGQYFSPLIMDESGAIGTKMILGKQGFLKYKNILEIRTRSGKKLSEKL